MKSTRLLSITCAVALAAGGIAATTGVVSAATAAPTATVRITPNPASAAEPFEGWGTSLVWFANATGNYPADVRQKLFDAVFGEGVNNVTDRNRAIKLAGVRRLADQDDLLAVDVLGAAFGSGATFVARSHATQVKHMMAMFDRAIKHEGFSVVAPTSTMDPFSTWGRKASCWALLNL